MSWEAEVSEISKRRGLAKAQGGAESIDRQHNQGKLTIRERIDSFLDADSFREHGKMAGGAHLDEFGAVESALPNGFSCEIDAAWLSRSASGPVPIKSGC